MNKQLLLLALLGALSACGAGSGAGLDNQGLPIDEGNGGEPPAEGVTLAQLQTEIFGAICAACHTGANAPQGLRLDSLDNSYAYLVNQAANEVPALMRVNPGDPDASYLIKKLAGAADIVGGRMPLGGPYLTDAQIERVRTWIANGAPYSGTGTQP